MHIFEIQEIENTNIIYNFEIKPRNIQICSQKYLTDKWMNLENWEWVYKKLTGIARSYVKTRTKTNKENELEDMLPGLISIKIKLKPISREIRRILDVTKYQFDHYFNIKIEYKDEILDRELNKVQPEIDEKKNVRDVARETVRDNVAVQFKSENKLEYSPTRTSHETAQASYTPTVKHKQNGDSAVGYTPTPKRQCTQPDHIEYVPTGTEKISRIVQYTPTKITESSTDAKEPSIASSDFTEPSIIEIKSSQSEEANSEESIIADPKLRSNRNLKPVNYSENIGNSSIKEHKKHRGKDKKKEKIAKLFDDLGNENVRDGVKDTPESSSKASRTPSSKSVSKSSKSRKSDKVRDHQIDLVVKRVTPNLNPENSVTCALLDATLPIRELNMFTLSDDKIRQSFDNIRSKLDKIVETYKRHFNTKKLKHVCDDPLFVHEVLMATQLEVMYNCLQEAYIPHDDSGANYCDLISKYLLPKWVIHMYTGIHKVSPVEPMHTSS